MCLGAQTVLAQDYVPVRTLEARHNAATEVHHDAVVRVARLSQDEARQARAKADQSAVVAKLRKALKAGGGLVTREALKRERAALQDVSDPLVHTRTELRLAVADERVARVKLILARSDLVTQLLRMSERSTRRGEIEGRRAPRDRQREALLARSQRLLKRLAALQQLDDPDPAPFVPEFSAETSDPELTALANDSMLLADASLEHARAMAPVVARRRALVDQLGRSSLSLPGLSEALARERISLTRCQSLQADLNKRADDYAQCAGRLLVEVTCRNIRRAMRAVANRG